VLVLYNKFMVNNFFKKYLGCLFTRQIEGKMKGFYASITQKL
jgi:hypothetical protein